MTFSGDPYRILGLKSGASPEDVKRAYRVLVKRYHPDFAGESAVPRFVAIQQAYEAITGSSPQRPRLGPAAPSPQAAPRRPPEAPRRPSDADPDRTRATRETFRTRRADPGPPPGGPEPPPRTERPRPRPEDPPGARDQPGNQGRRGPGVARKASLGSTSYDDATDWEPEWDGATWYGQSSGTHWTVNPREYADPRKHGPEYLARARRRAEAARAQAERAAADGPPPAPDRGEEPSAPPPREDRRWARSDQRTSADGPAASAARERPAAPPPPPPFERGAPRTAPRYTSAPEARATATLAAVATSIPARVLAAVIAWPPIGYVASLAVGEATGCIRYAASCTPEISSATLLVQPIVVLLLLLVPAVARLAAVGSIGLLIAAVPAAAALSASGGNRGPSNSAVALFLGILVMSYVVAVVGAASHRLPLPGWLQGRGQAA